MFTFCQLNIYRVCGNILFAPKTKIYLYKVYSSHKFLCRLVIIQKTEIKQVNIDTDDRHNVTSIIYIVLFSTEIFTEFMVPDKTPLKVNDKTQLKSPRFFSTTYQFQQLLSSFSLCNIIIIAQWFTHAYCNMYIVY